MNWRKIPVCFHFLFTEKLNCSAKKNNFNCGFDGLFFLAEGIWKVHIFRHLSVCTRWENFLRMGIIILYLKSWRCELWIWRSHFGTSSGFGRLNSTHAILGSVNRTGKLCNRKLSRYKMICITVIDNSFNYHYFHITGSRNVWDCATLREHVGSPPFFCGERFCSSFEFFVLYYF